MKNKIFILLLLAIAVNQLSFSQTLVKNMSSTDGTVYTVHKNAGTYYIGGQFNYVGLMTGSSALVTKASDYPNMDFPAFNGTVRAAVADGSGGWFVGGTFNSYDGVAVNSLVHVLSNKTIDPAFNVALSGG